MKLPNNHMLECLKILVTMFISALPWAVPDLPLNLKILISTILFAVIICLFVCQYIMALKIIINQQQDSIKQIELEKEKQLAEFQDEHNKLSENRNALKTSLESRDKELDLYKDALNRTKNILDSYIAVPTAQNISQIKKLLKIIKDEETLIKERMSNER